MENKAGTGFFQIPENALVGIGRLNILLAHYGGGVIVRNQYLLEGSHQGGLEKIP